MSKLDVKKLNKMIVLPAVCRLLVQLKNAEIILPYRRVV